MDKKKDKLVNLCISQEMYQEILDFAQKYTQGNLSYAIRMAIVELLKRVE